MRPLFASNGFLSVSAPATFLLRNCRPKFVILNEFVYQESHSIFALERIDRKEGKRQFLTRITHTAQRCATPAN